MTRPTQTQPAATRNGHPGKELCAATWRHMGWGSAVYPKVISSTVIRTPNNVCKDPSMNLEVWFSVNTISIHPLRELC